jgi:sugar O-acyltransferase (sialic acid O-acetyltransferase NeuD family)
MSLPVIVVGAGGHAAVVADAAIAMGLQVLGFTDHDSTRHGLMLCGRPVLGGDDVLAAQAPDAILLLNGIGGVGAHGDVLRYSVQQRLTSDGWRFTGVRHPSSVVSPFASIAVTAQLLAGSIVQAGARIAEGCIVNSGAIIEHDVSVGAWTHVAPRALVCGGVDVGTNSHVGAGAVVRQGVRLGAATIIGAGAVVVADCDGNCVLVGVPARQRRHHQ